MKIKIVLLIILLASPSRAQKNEYSTASISDSLKKINAIVRLNQIDVTISSQRSMAINTKKRVITVLNEKDFPHRCDRELQ
jgi:hypothetical protein